MTTSCIVIGCKQKDSSSVFKEVVMGIEFINLGWQIMCTYGRQWLHWMWLWDFIFFVCVWKLLSSKMLLLEGQNGQTWKDHMHIYCTLCHLPNVDGQIDPSLYVASTNLQCMLYIESWRALIILVCDWYYRGWHMECLMLFLDEVQVGKWFCPWCTK
jgi:hypothetical protein